MRQCRNGPLEVVTLPGLFVLAFLLCLDRDPGSSQRSQVGRDTLDRLGRWESLKPVGAAGELRVELIGAVLATGLELFELSGELVAAGRQSGDGTVRDLVVESVNEVLGAADLCQDPLAFALVAPLTASTDRPGFETRRSGALGHRPRAGRDGRGAQPQDLG